jgi:hypothetical protein
VLSGSNVLILPIVWGSGNDLAHMQMTQCLVSGNAVDHWQFMSMHHLNMLFPYSIRSVMSCVSISELTLTLCFLAKYQPSYVNI